MSKESRRLKKQSRLWYRVTHQKKKPNWFVYFWEVVFSFFIEIFRRLLKFVVVTSFVCILFASTIGYFFIYPKYLDYRDEVDYILQNTSQEDFKINEGSIIYDNNGDILANLYETSNLEYLKFEDIPANVVNAFVAVEDRTFWQNNGFDLKGIIRVGYRFIMSKGEEVHGASTITQQLARGTYLSREVKLDRKIKELIMAMEMSKIYSKREIMEFYCNDVCFANGIYGIQGASWAYFNKDAEDLTLSQTAYLCAIPNSPEYYNPLKDVSTAIPRRDKILKDMLSEGYISQDEFNVAVSEEIVLEQPDKVFNDYLSSYAIDCAVRYIMKMDKFMFKYSFEDMDSYEKYKKLYENAYAQAKTELYTGGYKIYTSLDKKVYKKAQKVLNEKLSFDKEKDKETGLYKLQGALTIIDNETNKVIAVVGGRKQKTNGVYSFNRAYQGYRQPGSTFKPIAVYTPALENGYTPNSTLKNIDVTTAKKKGVDAQKLYGTSMSLRSAVEHSKNGCAWQLFDKITPKVGLSYVSKMHMSKLCPNDYNNASALGGLTYGVTTVEMAGAYRTLVNHGVFSEPTCITSIKDKDGNEVFEEYDEVRVYSAKAADDMVDILKGVPIRGTASKLGWSSKSDIEAMCKTGTTNNSKDGWLCGATPYYTISVWVGYDQPKTLNNLYGATYPGEIWRDCMLKLVDGLEKSEFIRDTSSYTTSSTSGGYYSYLEGRDDSEVLSDGYTVGDYRSDRVIGESITAIIEKMKALDKGSDDYEEKLTKLYNDAMALVDTIYSVKYTAEMKGKVESAYKH